MIKVGLIGIGRWGKNHLRSLITLQKEGLFDKLVVCDSDIQALKAATKEIDVQKTTNWKDLLNDDQLDMVSIATPTSTHYTLAKAFLEQGKDVFVEKPLATSVEECNELITTARDTGSGLMVGHIFRFHPAILALKKKIENKEFGDIIYVTIRRQTLRPPQRDMGVMFALGIHDVDLTSFLLGDIAPSRIFADVNYYYTSHEEMAFIIQDFEKTKAYSYESWLNPVKGKLRELSLIGSNKSAYLNFSIPNKFSIYDTHLNFDKKHNLNVFVSDNGVSEVTVENKEPLKEELRHFISESQKSKQYISNAEIGKKSVIMILKAIESSKQGNFIQLNNMF